MRFIHINSKLRMLFFTFLLSIVFAHSLRADSGELSYELAGLTLCLTMEEAKNILVNEGFVYQDEKFTKSMERIEHVVTIGTNTHPNNKSGLVTSIVFVERGNYSPVEIGVMANNEKYEFEKLYGTPTGCDSSLATVFAFACYYGDPEKTTPLLTISVNKKGKKHALAINDCNAIK